jgi:DNA-binding response OmpR family regulator
MRILLIEDDAILGNGLQAGLQSDGYAVDWVQCAEDGEHALHIEQYAALVLDLSLPGKDGLMLLKELRASGNDLLVLILTAHDTVQDRVAGLDSGADDYLIKPFALDELCARLRALLRRSGGRVEPVLRHGALELNPAAHSVTLAGQKVEVSAREFAVLLMLLDNQGKVLSRAQLEESLYSWGEEVESNTVEVHIHHLRKKLGKDVIRTVRGVGYSLA